MRIDKAPEGGKFRATAAAALNATPGAWGDADLLNVAFDASGDLVAAAATNVVGVIWTKEGRKPLSDGSDNEVIGGRKYTVFTYAELVEAETAATPALVAGDLLYGAAAATVTDTPGAGAIFVGAVLGGGSRVLININGQPVG